MSYKQKGVLSMPRMTWSHGWMVKFIVMQVHHARVCADEGNLDWCAIIAERYFSCTNVFDVYGLYKENNITVSYISDEVKAHE